MFINHEFEVLLDLSDAGAKFCLTSFQHLTSFCDLSQWAIRLLSPPSAAAPTGDLRLYALRRPPTGRL